MMAPDGFTVGAREIDFDAFLAEQAGGPLLKFKFGGYQYVVPHLDMEAFAAYTKMGDAVTGEDIGGMLRMMKEMVRDQLLPDDRDLWMAARPPWEVLKRVIEAIAEAAVGRPTEGLSSSGGPSAPTGEPWKADFSAAATLPPPSAA